MVSLKINKIRFRIGMLGKKGCKNRNEWPNLNLVPICMSVFLQAKVTVLFLS